MIHPGDDLLEYLILPQPSSLSLLPQPHQHSQPHPSPDSSSRSCPSTDLDISSSHQSQSKNRKRRKTVNETSNSNIETGITISGSGSMEVAINNPAPALAPSLPQHASDAPDAPLTLSLEDYLATTLPLPPKPTSPSVSQKQKQNASLTSNSNSNAAPVPVAVGARSSRNTIQLHEKYQSYALEAPILVFTGSSDRGWGVNASFLGEHLVDEGPFNSKQEAKESLSGQALQLLSRKEANGELSKPSRGKNKKRALSSATDSNPSTPEKTDPGPNYIGQLLEFQRATNAPQPVYNDFQLGIRFSCTITIDTTPTPLTFGTTDDLFRSKKIARQHTAGLVVQHYKDTKQWPETFTALGGIKKKNTPSTATTNSTNSTNSPVPIKSSPSSPATPPSYTQRVAHLAQTLGLSTPEYRFSENDAAPGFHTVACMFRNGGAHEGPIGEVRHIFGKKKAKEECAKNTLEYLNAELERRMSFGRKMMAGVEGGEQVVGAACGIPVDGRVEAIKRAYEESEGEEGEEDEAEFEDAVQELGRA